MALVATALAALIAYDGWVDRTTQYLTSSLWVEIAAFIFPAVALGSSVYAVRVAIQWGRGRARAWPYFVALFATALAGWGFFEAGLAAMVEFD